MLAALANIFRITELRQKVLFTLAMFIVFRAGTHIPVPGVNASVIEQLFRSGNLFGLLDMFSGGALSKFSIFAMSITPYINASIILQLLKVVVPTLEQWSKEGEEGFKKTTKLTRMLTVALAFVQACGMAYGLKMAINNPGIFSILLIAITLTAGTVFLMWIGEQITARGVGNGISLIIFAGIVGGLPRAFLREIEMFTEGIQPLAIEIFILAIVVAIVGFIVFVEQATRRIPLESPRRVVGRNQVVGGQASYLPFKVNTAGVIPVIFASSIMFVPAIIASWMPNVSWMQSFAGAFVPGHITYSVIFAALIIFFTYFYTAIQYNPTDIADNLKKSGGFIPGIRPGKKTAEYIDHILARISLPGSIFLAVISVGPLHLKDALNMSFYIGGTSVLIVVGVALDTLRQLEAHLHTNNYAGFLKHGRIRGRMAS